MPETILATQTILTQTILTRLARAIHEADCATLGLPATEPTLLQQHICQQRALLTLRSLSGIGTTRARFAAGAVVRDLLREYHCPVTDTQALALAAAAVTAYECHLDGTVPPPTKEERVL